MSTKRCYNFETWSRFAYYVRPLGHLAGPVLHVVTAESGERSDSVVESLTRDGGATGSSFTSVTALCP